jgi:hypothetical protein
MSADESVPVQVADKAVLFADLLGFASLTEQMSSVVAAINSKSDRTLGNNVSNCLF